MGGRKIIKKGEISSDIKMYTTKEVATVLRVTPDRVRDLIKDGRIKAYMHRGGLNLPHLLILEKDLKEFLQNDFLSPYVKGAKKTWKKCGKIWR